MSHTKPSVESARITKYHDRSFCLIEFSNQVLVEHSNFFRMQKPMAFQHLVAKHTMWVPYGTYLDAADRRGMFEFTRVYSATLEGMQRSLKKEPLFYVKYSPNYFTEHTFLRTFVNDLVSVDNVYYREAMI